MSKAISCGRDLCARQHRFFAPVICVFEGCARLLLVDREAAVVSESFDYLSDPVPLATVMYRYVNAAREQHGYDLTATPASQDEHMFFAQVKSQFPRESYLYDTFDTAAAPGWPTYKLRIHAQWFEDLEDSSVQRDSAYSVREFLVGRPAYDPASGAGKCTLGFAAWDVSRQRSVFIKDYWRTSRPDALTEYEVYRRFAEGDSAVRNIPTVLGGSDVPGSSDIASRRPCAQGLPPSTTSMIHTRLVIKEICRPLGSFRDWHELTSVMRDALEVHKAAWEDYGILHCDMSAGSILIYDGEPNSSSVPIGLLADWDLAKTHEQAFIPRALQLPRTGTWQFMSAALQRFPDKPHMLSDDLEAVMHVLNWLAVQHMRTNVLSSSDDMTQYLQSYYDTVHPDGKGSASRYHRVYLGEPVVPYNNADRTQPFVELLRRLGGLCRIHYELVIRPSASGSSLQSEQLDFTERQKKSILSPSDGTGPSESLYAPLNTHEAFLEAFKQALEYDRLQWQMPKMRRIYFE
ncbi:hypothetical protein FKP32DRAFT_1630835 [Trametes sanguinea]|nr:hypothetical protein FKP32DRAFT_1630835 [Trametes sanguinea]